MQNKKKIGFLLYLIYSLQRVNVVLGILMVISGIILISGFFLFNVFEIEKFKWMVSSMNIIIFIGSLIVKCFIIPIKEFLTVFVISFFESTKMYDELLELPSNLLEKLNLKIKGKNENAK